MAKFKSRVEIIILSDQPFVKADKVEKAEAWIDAATTMGFTVLGSISKYGITDVQVNAEVSEKLGAEAK